MRILVTGGTGQLGYDVVRLLHNQGIPYAAPSRDAFNLENKVQMNEYMATFQPTHIIHCAAYTAVDKAETDQQNCYAVNVVGTKHIVELSKQFDCTLVYISTDYVFDGSGEDFYQVNAVANPINYYGLTKWEGEEWVRNHVPRHFICRVSWLFGNYGNNFVKTMIRLGSERDSINIVNDQIGSPTYTLDAAQAILKLLGTIQFGTYHIRNEGVCTWADFGEAIFQEQRIHCIVNRISTIDYPTPAKRPSNSRLDMSSLMSVGITMPHWTDALRRMLHEQN